jgi:hypothetical protein
MEGRRLVLFFRRETGSRLIFILDDQKKKIPLQNGRPLLKSNWILTDGRA